MFMPKLTDNCNVNLVELGERFVAMTETPLPVQFDPATLEAAGVAWDVPGELTTAHPHLDRASGGMLNYAAKLGPRNHYRFFLLGPEEGAEPEVIASRPVREPAYMHSFGLTERWIVLAEYPFTVNPLRLATSGRPYIENFRWKPELGTRFTLFDRASGEAKGPFTTDPLFGFHFVNAYEDEDGRGGRRHLHVPRRRHRRGPLPRPPSRRQADRQPRTCTGSASTTASGAVATEKLFEQGFDLPRINYGRCNERPYRYVWGVGTAGTGYFDRIVAADLEGRETSVWHEAGRYPGEPVFVAEPGAEAENAGVLLSVVLDADTETSFLLVLDAATLEERARAAVPHHIPFSFHGQFSRRLSRGPFLAAPRAGSLRPCHKSSTSRT